MNENIAIDELIKGIKIYNNILLDINGKTYTGEEYICHYYEGMQKQYDKKLFPRNYEFPTGAQLELTSRCNQRCRHCYNQSGNSENNQDDLTLEEWKKIAYKLGELGIFQCVLSGGEPTLMGEGLFEIMDILYDYDVKFIIITNGMLIDENKIQRLKKYKYSWFQVSIDGSRPELHKGTSKNPLF